MSFRVEVDLYRGPLDLLLYLVRKHEVTITDIPIAKFTNDYLGYIAVLEKLDFDAVGDFVEMASILIEIKSRFVLPKVEEEEEPWEDPREGLVQRLLEYKKFKDAASILEERGRQFQQTYSRQANDLPPRTVSPSEQPIREVELWDLVSALGRVLELNDKPQESNIVYDDTPIQTHMQNIHGVLANEGRASLTQMLATDMNKSRVIGVFLAVLELVRHHSVEAEQPTPDGEIWLRRGEEFAPSLDLAGEQEFTAQAG